MERNSFVFYGSFFEAIKELEDKDKGIISYAIMQYGLTGETPKLTGYLKSMFLLIKPQIDANNERYENGCKGGEYGKLGKEYGKLGGRPKSKKSIDKQRENGTEEKLEPPINPPRSPRLNPNNPPNEDVDVDVNEDVNENEDVNGKEDCKGKNQRVSDPNEETTTAFPFVERPETAKDTANDTSTTRLLNPKSNDTGNGVRTGAGMPEGTKPQTMTSPSETKSPESCPALARPEVISSTSAETFKARVEYAKSLGIEEGVARRICNFAQSKKVALCEMHYKGFVGKSGKEAEEAFNLLNFLAKSGKNPSGLKRINSG